MNLHRLCGPPSTELAQALARFESQFTYPLGPDRFFRISHGDDYPRFFRAMGEAACFAAERQGSVLGTLGAALRRLLLPDGQERDAVYVADLKISPAARGGKTLVRLADAIQQWVGERANAAFSVVMDGTAVTPLRYTGRLGIPLFQELGRIVVLRLPTAGAPDGREDPKPTTGRQGEVCYRRLSVGRFASAGGSPSERSEMTPLWFMTSDGGACGRLEDTRRAKRLIAGDGVEMQSAHLSCFAYRDPRSGVDLLNASLRRAASIGFPAVFVAVPSSDVQALSQGLNAKELVVAPATIYGTGLEPTALWNVNTAEI
jgi:hypothetical protein